MHEALPDTVIYHRFARNTETMRSGKFNGLEMMSPPPSAGLDTMMAEVLVLASKMEFQTIELEVCFCILLLCDLVLAVACPG